MSSTSRPLVEVIPCRRPLLRRWADRSGTARPLQTSAPRTVRQLLRHHKRRPLTRMLKQGWDWLSRGLLKGIARRGHLPLNPHTCHPASLPMGTPTRARMPGTRHQHRRDVTCPYPIYVLLLNTEFRLLWDWFHMLRLSYHHNMYNTIFNAGSQAYTLSNGCLLRDSKSNEYNIYPLTSSPSPSTHCFSTNCVLCYAAMNEKS